MARGRRHQSAATPPAPPLQTTPVVARGLDLDFESITRSIAVSSGCQGCLDDEFSDGYCRCSVIEEIRVDDFDLPALVARYEGGDEVSDYALALAIARAHPFELGTQEGFEFKAVSGYYGQELDGVYFTDEVAKAVDRRAGAVLSLPDPDARVREALSLAGVRLPELADATFQVIDLPREMLGVPTAPKESSGYGLGLPPILATVIERDGRFEILDGEDFLAVSRQDRVEVLLCEPAGTRAAGPRRPRPRPRSLSESLRAGRRQSG